MATNPFQVMVGQIFSNAHFADDGVYTPDGGAAVPVRVIERHESEASGILVTSARQPARVFDLLVSEVPVRPVENDTLVIGAESFRIRGAEPDDLGYVWLLDVEPA